MTEKTAKKARDIIDKLEQHRMFLEEYDKCSRKTIVVKQTRLSNLCETLEFGDDKDFEDSVRQYVVRKILNLEKQLEEIGMSEINLQEACRIIVHELQKHGEFYDAFVESVASVLKPRERYVGDGCFCIDIDDGTDYKGLADEIVKRISGEE